MKTHRFTMTCLVVILAALNVAIVADSRAQTVEASDPVYIAQEIERFEATAAALESTIEALTARVAALEASVTPTDPPAVSLGFRADTPTVYTRGSGQSIAFDVPAWPAGHDVLVMMWSIDEGRLVPGWAFTVDAAPGLIPASKLDELPAGRNELQLRPRVDGLITGKIVWPLTVSASAGGQAREVRQGDNLQQAIDALPDGQTLRIIGPFKHAGALVIRNKSDVTIQAVGERAVVTGGVELHGRINRLRVVGLEPRDNQGGSGLRLGNGSGFGVFVDGAVFDDCKFAANTFGMSLMAYNPAQPDHSGEFARGIQFIRPIVAFNHNPQSKNGKHSSGLYADRLADLSIIDGFWWMNGHHPDVPGAVQFAQNQGIYYDAQNGPLTLHNVAVGESSYCSIQVRNHEALDARSVVGLLNTNSMFFSNGQLQDFLFWRMTPFQPTPGGLVYGNTLLDAQDGTQASKANPARFRNGLIAEVADGPQAPNTFAMAFRDGQATSDDGKGPPTQSAYADLQDVRIVGFKNPFNKADRIVRQAGVVVADDYGPYRSPDAWPGGLGAYIDANVNRPLGVWDPQVHGAEAMLRFVGVIE